MIPLDLIPFGFTLFPALLPVSENEVQPQEISQTKNTQSFLIYVLGLLSLRKLPGGLLSGSRPEMLPPLCL